MKSIEMYFAMILAEDAAKELKDLIRVNLSVGNTSAAAGYARTLNKLNQRRFLWWTAIHASPK